MLIKAVTYVDVTYIYIGWYISLQAHTHSHSVAAADDVVGSCLIAPPPSLVVPSPTLNFLPMERKSPSKQQQQVSCGPDSELTFSSCNSYEPLMFYKLWVWEESAPECFSAHLKVTAEVGGRSTPFPTYSYFVKLKLMDHLVQETNQW